MIGEHFVWSRIKPYFCYIYSYIYFRCEKKAEKLFVHVFTVRPAMYAVAIGKTTFIFGEITLVIKK